MIIISQVNMKWCNGYPIIFYSPDIRTFWVIPCNRPVSRYTVLHGFIHAFFPKSPHIPRDFWLNPFLAERPFSLLRPFQIVIFWSMVGFSYLLTLDVSFSLWFFFFHRHNSRSSYSCNSKISIRYLRNYVFI